MPKLRLFPTQALPAFIEPPPADPTERRSVLVISDFSANVGCKSTAGASPAAVTGAWSASLKYWRDSTNDGLPNGTYVEIPSTVLKGSLQSGGTDPLAALRTENPLVYDDAVDSKDVYLFRTNERKGYLDKLTSNPNIASIPPVSSAGRVTEVTLADALQIITVPTNPARPETGLNVSIGSLTCRSVDRRGL